jgi:uncharacterized protein YggE
MFVSGTGTVILEPDLASINIGVRSEAADAADALAMNNEKISAVIQSMLALGVAAEDIRTQNFSIYSYESYENQQLREAMPEEELFTESASRKTYAIENTVTVIVRDLDTLGTVLSTVVEQGANTIYGIVFDVTDRAAALEQARLLAIENAKTQAQAVAEAAGIKLGEIQTIDLTEYSYNAARYDDMGFEQAVEEGPVPIEAGSLDLQVTISLIYSFK